jgi:hypothetical protein
MQASIPVDQFVAEPLMVAFTMTVDEELGKCTAEVALVPTENVVSGAWLELTPGVE